MLNTKRLLIFCVAWLSIAQAADRPNFVFIVSEDNSIHYLRHFFKGGAITPNIEALAAQGLTFDHAFSNAPVCSTARTTLATSCLGPRIGTQFHRRYMKAPMPEGVKMFQQHLQHAGYYTTNKSKTDYNADPGKGVWDESSNKAGWHNRKAGQPFFHMESHPTSHEGSLHFSSQAFESKKTSHDPSEVILADYLPDTPIFRYTHASYLDRMVAIDNIVGATLDKLKKDGVLEDTFVFYFGDHGGVLPRSKGYAYESGLHVPLVIRIPENFSHLVDAERGTRQKGFVSFIDFGPTVLNLAGIPRPTGIDGMAFLGKGIRMDEVNARDEVLGYADRFDEKYDLVRTIRKGKYQYIRSYQPYLPDGLMNIYRYKMLAYKEWRALYDAGTLSDPQNQFFMPKAAEMLFDCEADPHQVNNLADDPGHAAVLHDLRERLQQKLKTMPDLSFYPESTLCREAMNNPVAWGQQHKTEIAKLIDTADLALLPYAEAESKIGQALGSDNPHVRYWAAMACTSFGNKAKPLVPEVSVLLGDESPLVQLRAIEFLGMIGHQNPQPHLIQLVNTTSDSVVATEVLNSIVWFKDFFNGKYPVKRTDFSPSAKGADVDDRLNYINGVPYPPKGQRKSKSRKKGV